MWQVGSQGTEPAGVVGGICCPPPVVDTGGEQEMLPGASGRLAARSFHCEGKEGLHGGELSPNPLGYPQKTGSYPQLHRDGGGWGVSPPPDMGSPGTWVPGMGGCGY